VRKASKRSPHACTLSLLINCPCSLPPAVGATPVHYAAAFGLQKVLGHLLSADDSDDQLNAEDAGNLLSNANPYAHKPAPPSQARFAHTLTIDLCLCRLRCALVFGMQRRGEYSHALRVRQRTSEHCAGPRRSQR